MANIGDVKDILNVAMEVDDAVLMQGAHGIGKSKVVEEFCEENGYFFYPLFLSHQETGDIIGNTKTIEHVIGTKMVQAKDADGNVKLDENNQPIRIEVDDVVYLTTWTKPTWLQRMEEAAAKGMKTVLFLDELNRATIDVRQAALQLVLERQIHEHKLPMTGEYRTLIVAAVNPPSSYQVEEMDIALLDRFLCINLEPDVQAWLDWTNENNINPIVRGFITENPDKLHYHPALDVDENPDSEDDFIIGTSPRSLVKLSHYVDKIDMIPQRVLFTIIEGKIGPEIGRQFLAYYKNHKDYVKVEDIEKLVNNLKNKTKDVEKIALGVKQLIDGLEAIQVRDLIEQLSKKYIGEGIDLKPEETYPYLAMLYAVNVELLNSYLKTLSTNRPLYMKLTKIDKVINNKKVFKRVVDTFD